MPYLWAAPESIITRKFSKYSDAWSFGVFLHELFSPGQNPYDEFPIEIRTNAKRLWIALKDGTRMKKPKHASKDV